MAKRTKKSEKAEKAKTKGTAKITARSVDLSKEIRRAVDTGKVVFGSKQSEKSILMGKSKLLIVVSNAPELVKEKAVHQAGISGIPYLNFEGTGLQLGSICGKPFNILLMSIEEVGKSTIVTAVEKIGKE